MLFSSNEFIFLFLPVSLLGYLLLKRAGRNALLAWLTLTSLFFYGYWNPLYLILLGFSMVMNFLFSQALGGDKPEKEQSRWLVFAIVCNLLLLMYYKYLFPVLNFLHIHGVLHRGFADVVLPLGISFFTFTQIAYLIDLRQQIAKRQGLLPYSVFVTFFPHLIAGPIIHPREMMPQLEQGRIRAVHTTDVALGMSWFVMGLAKKVIIADRMAPLADMLYQAPQTAGFATAWCGALAYAMQLYFDFSGYSDMALGLARMFGLHFPINFNSPFKSRSVIEFWTRWHMTLSRYLNEYLYTPILMWVNGKRIDAGKKVTRKAAATPEGYLSMVFFPTMTTMFIAGVWHGAGLQFLVFGALHGFYLSVNHAWRLLTPKGHALHAKLPVTVSVVLTFVCVLIGMVYFRAASVHDGNLVVSTMFGFHGLGPSYKAFPLLAEIPTISKFETTLRGTVMALAVCFFIVWSLPNTQEILNEIPKDQTRMPSLLPRLNWRMTATWSLGLGAVFSLAVLMLDASTRFLYFQF